MRDPIERLQASVGDNEKILWKSRPNKKCFILESIFNPLLPFAIIWLIIDLSTMSLLPSDKGTVAVITVFFFLVHLMPVWIYLIGILFMARRHKNIAYIITDRNIYISSGLFSYSFVNKPFAELNKAEMHRGIFDQWCGCGDVRFGGVDTSKGTSLNIDNIKDYEEVYKLVIKLQEDVHADVQFPNAYRPDSNPGYNPSISRNENISRLLDKTDKDSQEK